VASCPKFAWNLTRSSTVLTGNVMDESQVLKESTKEAQQDNLLEALVHHKK
jgi:hypothetical protein